jgi:lipopolysaccharide transport system permease protein
MPNTLTYFLSPNPGIIFLSTAKNKTITRIGPKKGFFSIDLAEIWSYRELLYFLTWRDIKIRYKQTVIGIAWAVLQPVLTTAIFAVLFSRFAGFSTDIPYPLFALSGLLIWLFVHTAVSMSSTSFVNNSNLVTKVYFPRLIVPLAGTVASLFDLVFGFAILAVLMLYYAIAPSATIVLAPLFVVLAFVQAASLGTLFAALNINYRDVKFALPFLLQVWMIASPVFYPASLISERWRLFFALNPLTGILEGFRSSVFGTPFDWPLIGVSIGSLIVLTVISFFIFGHLEDDFADVI